MTRAALLTAAYYAALFMTLGVHLPYWPLWLKSWGLTEAEIGFYLGLVQIPRMLGATLVPALADRTARRRATILATALGAAALAILHPAIEAKALLLLAGCAFALAMAPTVPLGEALGLRAAARHGFPYAPVRAAGSVAFLAANLGVGLWLGLAGPEILPWLLAAGLILIGALGAVHPGGGAMPGQGPDRAMLADLLRLYGAPVFLLFAIAAALGQGSHAVYYVYSALSWQAQGLSAGLIGALWAFGVLVETALMLGPGRRWIGRLGPARALALAGLAGAVRWGAMALEPASFWLWPLQAMHALTFAMGHLAAMAFLAAAVPARLSGSAQGALSGVVAGSVNVAATFAAAGLVAWSGIAAAYLMAAVMSAAALIGALALARVWTGGRVAVF